MHIVRHNTIIYIGNASEEKFQTFIAAKLVAALIAPARYAKVSSVSGYFHVFVSVGKDAKKSLSNDSTIAVTGFLVIYHTTNAMIDSIPQRISNFDSFQNASFLNTAIVKTNKGKKPTVKTGIAARPTPSANAAANAIKGATAQTNQVTLFGLTVPFIIAFM